VVIKDLTIVAFAEAVAINVGNGNVTVKGCDINANNSYGAFGCNGGNLSAYANNITNVLTAVYGTGCEANLKHNYWGVYNGDPAQFGMDEEPWIDDWNARLGNEVDTYADGYITTGGSVTLGGASLIGGTGTAVIVSHGKSNPPFGNGISQYIYSMCGEYYDFFVRGGSGAWSIVLPVDNNTDCNANVLNKENVYSITDIADCDTTGNPACWDPVPKENISIPGQSLMIAGLTAGGLEGTQYVVGSSDGTDPTVIQLRSLTATSVRNVLPLALLMLALLLGSGGLILARKRR
jgi:hypothetical protein